MGSNDSNNRGMSRRQWLRAVGASGLAAAALSAAGVPRAILAATSAQDDSPEGFIALAFAQRAQAMTTRNMRLLEAIYDSANPQLLAFERDRAAFMADLGSRWKGNVLDYNASASLVNLQISGTTATAQIYETLTMRWIPAPRKRTRAELAWRRQFPEKFAPTSPTGPRGEITSTFGNRHELALEKGANGWRIIRDSYEEPDLYGASPDILGGSWSAVITGVPPNGTLRVPNAPAPAGDFSASACYNYNWTAAANYATSHCTASTYNANYCNYNACGGDCANFVSQCLRAGNQVNGGAWYTFNGACGTCGTTKTYAGTDTWANNYYLRNWVINSGRGVAKSSIGGLGQGDLVNYDWTGNGSYDHVTIVSDPVNDLICSHNSDRCNASWTMGGASRYLYTWVNVSYCV